MQLQFIIQIVLHLGKESTNYTRIHALMQIGHDISGEVIPLMIFLFGGPIFNLYYLLQLHKIGIVSCPNLQSLDHSVG